MCVRAQWQTWVTTYITKLILKNIMKLIILIRFVSHFNKQRIKNITNYVVSLTLSKLHFISTTMSHITACCQITACYCTCSFIHIQECTNFFLPRGHITGSPTSCWNFLQWHIACTKFCVCRPASFRVETPVWQLDECITTQ